MNFFFRISKSTLVVKHYREVSVLLLLLNIKDNGPNISFLGKRNFLRSIMCVRTTPFQSYWCSVYAGCVGSQQQYHNNSLYFCPQVATEIYQIQLGSFGSCWLWVGNSLELFIIDQVIPGQFLWCDALFWWERPLLSRRARWVSQMMFSYMPTEQNNQNRSQQTKFPSTVKREGQVFSPHLSVIIMFIMKYIYFYNSLMCVNPFFFLISISSLLCH